MKNLIFYTGGIILFILGMIVYGIVQDLRKVSLKDVLFEKNIKRLENPKLIVNKLDYKLHLYLDTILIKTYNIALGSNPKFSKKSKDDRYTPVGNYVICDKKVTDGLGKILILNYPNLEDAIRGIEKNIITKDEFEKIKIASADNLCPPMNTQLGGYIKIHGNGKFDLLLRNLPFILNWTDGSIAVNNSEIEELFDVCKVGTPVIIY